MTMTLEPDANTWPKRSAITYTEDNCPIPDGFMLLFFTDETVLRIPFNGFKFNQTVVGFEYCAPEYDVVVPWDKLERYVTMKNSDLFVVQLREFQSTCDHVFDEHHHTFAFQCEHHCLICGLAGNPHTSDEIVEGVEEDD